jgi:hypothetical protein
VTAEEEAATCNRYLDDILHVVRERTTAYRVNHTYAETLLALMEGNRNRAYVNLAFGNTPALVADITTLGGVLMRLFEVEEQLAMHKAVITNLSDLEAL